MKLRQEFVASRYELLEGLLAHAQIGEQSEVSLANKPEVGRRVPMLLRDLAEVVVLEKVGRARVKLDKSATG